MIAHKKPPFSGLYRAGIRPRFSGIALAACGLSCVLLTGCTSSGEAGDSAAPESVFSEQVRDIAVDPEINVEFDPVGIEVLDAGASPEKVFAVDDIAPEITDDAVHSITAQVADGFHQELRRRDSVDPRPPEAAEGGAQKIAQDQATLALEFYTEAADDPGEGEQDASRVVRSILGPDSAAPGFTMTWRGKDNGEISSLRLAAPTEASNEQRASAEGALTRMVGMPVVFPEQAVGPGAKWTVQSRVTGAATMLQTTTYELDTIDDQGRAHLEVQVEQRPAVGSLPLGDVDAQLGEDLTVKSAQTSSTGSLTIDPHVALPVAGELNWVTRVVYGGDAEVQVVQDNATSLRFES